MRKIRQLFFIFVSVLVVAEMIVRVFIPEFRRDFMTLDELGNRINRANYYAKVYSDKNHRGYFHLYTGKKGQRLGSGDRKDTGRKKLTAVIYGDSLSFGLHLDHEDTFPYLLEKKLSQTFPDKLVKVVNCSVVSSNLSELYQIYKHSCKVPSPDLVIVQTTIYDGPGPFSLLAGEVIGPDAQMALFHFQCSGDFLREKIIWKNSLSPLEFSSGRSRWVNEYKQYFGAWLPLYPISQLVRIAEHRHIQKMKYDCRQQDFPFLFDYRAFNVFDDLKKHFKIISPQVPSTEPAIEIIQQWQQDSTPSKLLVVNLPNARGLNLAKSRITNPKRQLITERFPMRSLGELVQYRQYYDKYRDELLPLNVSEIDFFPILEKIANEDMFFDNDNHFNEYGHQVIAESLHNKIQTILTPN